MKPPQQAAEGGTTQPLSPDPHHESRLFRLRDASVSLAVRFLFLLLAFQSAAQGQLLTKEAFSREFSIHVGGEQTPLVKDIASREVSIFVGQEPARPYAQAISREMSIVVTTVAIPARVTQLNVGVSPTGDRADLEWCGYNEIAQSDVVRYRIYVSTAPFTTVSNLSPHAIVPAGTCTLTITNLPPWQDHYFAVVAEDALGGSDSTVSYSAAYVLAPQAISREFSLFVGGEPTPAYGQAISREVSLLISTPEPPQRITQLNVTPSPTGDRATLEWCGYNEIQQRDVVRYDIFLSTSAFTSVSNLTRFATVPAGTCSLTLSNLTAFQDRYFAVVPVDATGASDPAVDFSAAYVLAPEAISREFSVFVGSEPASPYAQAISRELSILVPDNTVPDPVTGLTSGFIAGTSVSTFSAIDLNWSSYNEVQQRDVLRYRIYTASEFSTDVSTMELRTTVPAGTFRHSLGGLFGGAIYHVAVVSEDVLGNFNPTVRSVSAQASIGALGEVSELVVNSSIDSLFITWIAPEQEDAFLHHYNLYLGGSTNPISVTNTALSYNATGLQPATGYPFRLSTVDTFGAESAGVSQLAATWLPNPTNVVAQSFDGMVRLTWSHAEPNDLVKHYVIYNSHHGEDFNDVIGLFPLLTTRDTHVDITGWPNGILDYFAVTTVNISDGENPRVTTVSATPNPVPGIFADLLLTNVVSPSSVFRGQTITIDWTVRNVGAGSTSTRNGTVVNSWIDRVVLSPDTVLGDADDIALATAPHVSALSAGGSYAASATAQIPTNLTGFYHVFVQVNSGGHVYEHLDTAANIGTAPQTMFIGSSLPPSITTQPTNLAVNAYDNAQFSVSASGLPAPTYQWRLNGSLLAEQTSASLTLTNVQPWQAGNYDVVVANAVGSVTSIVARLTVLPAANPICVPPPSGLVGWWPGDGNANDLAGSNHGTLQNGAAYATGKAGQAFNLDGFNDYVDLGTSPALNFVNSSFTAMAWIYLTGSSDNSNDEGIISRYSISGGSWILGRFRDGKVWFGLDTDGGWALERSVSAAQVTSTGAWHHVAGVYNHSTGMLRLYVDGQSSGTNNGPPVTIYQNLGSKVSIGNWYSYDGFNGSTALKGLIDEASLFTSALQPEEISAIYAAGTAGMCKPQVPPSIVAQPTNVTVFATMPTTLRVQGVGDEPLRYQWRFNGGALAGGTNATLTFPSALPSLAGDYDVVVSNPLGAVTSVVATLTVLTDIPDLAVRSLSVPTNAPAGQPVPLVFTVTNQGSGTALLPWANAVFLATNASGSEPLSLGTFPQLASLAAGASVTLTQTMILPSGSLGTRFVGLTVDSGNQLFESNKANNTLVSSAPLIITAPDLEVSLLTSAATVVFGELLNVTWAVRNVGTGPTYANWADRLLLSTTSGSIAGATPLISVATPVSPLAPGASYTNTSSIRLPFGAQYPTGLYHIVLVADAGNAQPESNEANNLASRAISVTLPPLPDLTVGLLSTAALSSPGQTIPVTWVVTNGGPAIATGPWTETIRIVTEEVTRLTNSAQIQSLLTSAPTLGTFAYSNALAPGAFLTRTQFVTLPVNGVSGDTRVFVTVDARDEVFEDNETNNVAFAGNVLTIPVSLTLQLSSSQISENATAPLRATLTRNGSLTQALPVTVSNSHPEELSFVQSLLTSAVTNITIPAGQSVVVFNLYAVADHVVDANQAVTLTASAPGYDSASSTVTVLNVDLPTLTLSTVTNGITEGFTAAMTVTRDVVTSNALIVTLSSSSPGQLSPPNFVTIPPGAASTNFSVLAVDDANAEDSAAYSISASAAGFNPAASSVTVLDNDVPQLTVSLSAHSISEGAGAQAFSMTVTREPVGAGALNIEPTADDASLVTLPLRITIPPGQASRSFPVGVIDDTQVNGSRSVVLTAYALAAGSGQRLTEAVPDVVTVTDDDGSTLKLAAALKLVREGQNPATTVTVTRNTPATNNLVVSLTSSLTNEAIVPATIILSNGQASATFNLISISDGTNDGNQTVTLTATATNFTPGTETVIVSDTDLPDLAVSSITAPASAVPQQRVGIGYRVVNQGLSTTAGEFLTRVYLSRDAVVGGDDVLVAQFRNTNAVAVAQFIESTEQIELPLTVGNYWVVVETDAEQILGEVLEDNNTRISAAPIAVAADYSAWVQTSVTNAPAGTAVPLYGRATNSLGAPVSGKSVSVHVLVRGTQRILSATTDASGNFTTIFTPLPTEAGRYDLFATHPGVSTVQAQDTFSLLGFRAIPASVSVTVVESLSRSGSLTLENLSDVPLTGLTVQVISKPANLTVTASLPSPGGEGQGEGGLVLTGSGSMPLNYTFTATTADAYGTVQLRVTTAEGVSQDVYFGVSVEPLRPRLVATPVSLYAAMPVGGQAVVEFDVANLGGRDSGPITVSLPAVPWMHIATTNPMPSLAPGQTNRVTLVLTPATNLALGPYTGSLAISADNSGTSVPFNFRAMSESVGSLLVDVVDEFTYYAEGAPHLAGATVTVRDSVTQATVTNGVTGIDGHFIATNLNEGYYDIEVTADKHTTYRATHLLKAGITNEVQTFVSRQTVTYTWTVEPVTLEDRYRVTVETTFETVVPAPVVVIEPSVIDLAEIQGDEAQVNVRVTNHGLIAAQNFQLTFDSHPTWELKPLVENFGNLAARASIVIPVNVRRKPSVSVVASASPILHAAKGNPTPTPCVCPGRATWQCPCGQELKNYSANVTAINAGNRCQGSPPTPSAGGERTGFGGSQVGGVAVFGPVTQTESHPCSCNPGRVIGVQIIANGGGNSFVEYTIENTIRNVFFTIPELGTDAVRHDEASGKLRIPFSQEKMRLSGKTDFLFHLDWKCSDGVREFYGHLEKEAILSDAYRSIGVLNVDSVIPDGIDDMIPETPEDVISDAFSNFLSIPFFFLFEQSFDSDPRAFLWKFRYEESVNQQANGTTYVEGVRIAIREAPPTLGFVTPSLSEILSAGWQITLEANGRVETFSELWDETQMANGLSYFTPIQRWIRRGEASLKYTDSSFACVWPNPAEPINTGVLVGARAYNLSASRNRLQAQASPIVGGESSNPDLFSNADTIGVCARVKLRLEQDAVLTRDAFRATLELDNNGAYRLENVRVDVNIRPESGDADTNLFAIRLDGAPTVLSAIDGTGILAGNSTGTAKWLIIPTVDAAPTVATRFFVGGTLSYRLDGNDVTVPLSEVPITVLPSPRLTLQYFHQRDVFSDDPFTPVIEPAIPYSLAVMVQNRGYGQAKNFRITSAQPKIIENEKGLLIDFNIIATEVFKAGTNYGLTPSLTANFGDISAGDTAISRWLLTSTLQGLFIDYSARFEHIDGLGNPRLSLIDEVTIHEMNHLVQAGGIWEDAKPDFLVNEVPDIRDLPDTLYQSNGSTNPVVVIEQATVTPTSPQPSPPAAGGEGGAVPPGGIAFNLTAPMPGDWVYLRVPNPGNGQYRLTRVTRSDGTNISINTNVWTTDRTFIGLSQRPRVENILHLLDYNSTGSYTLTYEPGSDIIIDPLPPVSSVNPLPSSSREYFQVSWSGRDEGQLGQPLAGIAYYDIYVSVNGGNFTNWLPRTTLVSATYIGTTGSRYAFYSVATDANGNPELPPGTPDAETVVNLTNSPPSVTISNIVVIDEGQTLDLPFTVSDPDTEQLLSISLTGNSPPGVQLSSPPRRLTWATGEGNGPSTNLLTLVVRDDGFPNLSATGRVTVIVREVNSAPSLDAVPTFKISEGQTLTHTVRASDFDLPRQSLTFSLGAGAPSGAAIGATSGVFTWRPSDIQGGTTNRITVIVRDSGTPSLSATQRFDVVVRNSSPDFILSIGTTNVLVGQASKVSLHLRSGLELTSLSFRVVPDKGSLTGFGLDSVASELSGVTLVPDGTNGVRINLTAAPGQLLPADGVLANFSFHAPPQEHSSIVTLPVNGLLGTLANGTALPNGRGNGGRVFVIGAEPLLDAVLGTTSARSLVLYGQPGEAYEIQATTNLDAPQIWQPVRALELTDTFDIWTAVPEQGSRIYYRAMQLASPDAVRIGNVSRLTDGRMQFQFGGVANRLYVIEASTNLVNWLPFATNRAPIQFTIPTGPTPTNRFFRVKLAGACSPPPGGLVAWWPGDGNARDFIGTNHGVMLNGAGFAPGKVGSGFRFDGVDDYINVGPAQALHFTGTTPFTFAFWIAPENTGSPADILARKNDGISGDLEIYSDEYHQVSFWALAQAEPQLLVSTPIVPYGSFTHVVMTFDGSVKRIYIDGVMNSSIAAAPLLRNRETDLLIGVRRILNEPYFPNAYKGVIDEVMVFDRALTGNEIQRLHSAGDAGICIPPPAQ